MKLGKRSRYAIFLTLIFLSFAAGFFLGGFQNSNSQVSVITSRDGGLLRASPAAPEAPSGTSADEPAVQAAAPAVEGTQKSESHTVDGRLDLNSATLDELMGLPGIGETRAELIIAYRTKTGAFKKIEELMNIPGIGKKTFEAIELLVTIAPTAASPG